MSRIKLHIPVPLPFETQLAVRITDLNYGGHLGNDVVLSLIHEARVRFLKNCGYTELDLGGASIIMGDCAIEFKAEGFHGDQLKVEVGAGDFSRVSFDLFYRFTLADKNQLLALAKTGIVCFDYEARKVVAIPEGVQATLERGRQ